MCSPLKLIILKTHITTEEQLLCTLSKYCVCGVLCGGFRSTPELKDTSKPTCVPEFPELYKGSKYHVYESSVHTLYSS